MIDSADAMRSGLPIVVSHGCVNVGMRRCETVKPTNPAFGFAPAPVAPSSRISPRSARKRRDRGRMIVRLDLYHDVGRFARRAIAQIAARIEAIDARAFDHRRIVRIRDDGALRVRRMRRANHREQALVLRHAVDDPGRVEDFMAAVLRIRLREHHQLDIGRIAVKCAKCAIEIIDFVRRKRESKRRVGIFERHATLCEQRYRRQRTRLEMREQSAGAGKIVEHGLGHAVVKEWQERFTILVGKRQVIASCDPVRDAAFDSWDRFEPAVVRDVRRLRRPRRNRAGTGDDEQ